MRQAGESRPVLWSREALDDIKEQLAFVARTNPTAAEHIASRLAETGTALGRTPTGRPGRVTGTFEKSVSRLPYIIAYALSEYAGRESLIILRVIHSARNWPAEEWPE